MCTEIKYLVHLTIQNILFCCAFISNLKSTFGFEIYIIIMALLTGGCYSEVVVKTGLPVTVNLY